MSNIVSFGNGTLPSVQSLTTALRAIKEDSPSAGGVILKMDKAGHWVFGADQTEVEDDSRWAINPFSFVHGYICWGDREVLAEKMASVSQPLPELDPAPAGAKKGWEKQVGLSLRCMSGDDKDLEARYATTSVGGKRAVQDLAVAIAEQAEKDADKVVPIVKLKKDHYQHKSYGRINTPVFEILEWVSLNGGNSAVEEDADEPTADAPRRRRRVD
jgi:hypothetical protein